MKNTIKLQLQGNFLIELYASLLHYYIQQIFFIVTRKSNDNFKRLAQIPRFENLIYTQNYKYTEIVLKPPATSIFVIANLCIPLIFMEVYRICNVVCTMIGERHQSPLVFYALFGRQYLFNICAHIFYGLKSKF